MTTQQADRAWQPLVSGEQARRAVATAALVAGTLSNQERVEQAIQAAEVQSAAVARWPPYGVARGWAGLAIMCGYYDACCPGVGWDRTAHRYLSLAAHGAAAAGSLPLSLWTGAAGLAFAARYLSHNGARYRQLLAETEAYLLPATSSRVGELAAQHDGVDVSSYDLISGLTGVGAYLLLRYDDAEVAVVQQALLHELALRALELERPAGFFTPPQFLDSWMRAQHPAGSINCGLAHGVPGPLALLALALRAGIQVPALAAAVDQLAGWLLAQRQDDYWGPNWPPAMPLDREAGAFYRSAWCYGGGGVARALWLAGQALDEPRYREAALAAMDAICARPIAQRGIPAPTFCHGVAGLLQIVLRFAHDTGEPRFAATARELTAQLLEQYEPGTLLGYRSIEQQGRRVDQPGLLNGAPGVVLALLAATSAVEPVWDRLFLLA